jgi:3-deoxy-7-phosphoheptulonate synthase
LDVILVLRRGATEHELTHVVDRIEAMGLGVHVSRGQDRTVVGLIGEGAGPDTEGLAGLPGVERVVSVTRPYRLASREFQAEDTVIKMGDVEVGGGRVVVMAGPCSVENRRDLLTVARAVRKAGARFLRGGAFKPRTSPYSFQGLGEEGLAILAEAREETGLLVVTEVMDTRDVDLVGRYADVFQVGARNTQNFALLKELGGAGKPVLLKRGMMSTVNELLMSAEYLMSRGNFEVMLCERGIRTFENQTRNTLDLSLVPVVKELSHLPVIVDPSHGTGKWSLVPAMTRAAVAAGADGILVEVHHDPERAMSDGAQSLLPKRFEQLMKELRGIATTIGREI